MSLRQTAAQRPVLAAILCAGIQFLLTILILKLGKSFAPPETYGKVKLVAFASTVIFPLLLTQGLGLWRHVGFDLDKVRFTPVFILSLLTGVMFLGAGLHPKVSDGVGGEFLIQFINAFGEELLFRGVIFAILLTLPKWKAIVIGGLLFGSMHLIHGYMDGNWNHAMWSAVITSMAGMMFTAVRYETGSLWLVIFLHMIVNLCAIYSNIELAAGPAVLFAMQRLANVFQVALTLYVIVKWTQPRMFGQSTHAKGVV